MEEPRIICASCNSNSKYAGDSVFDEKSELYFCDELCFDDWASDNFDKVTDFYKNFNVSIA